MITTDGVLYLVIGTVLFFFWVYGIVSFVVDVKRQIIPWLRARREQRSEERRESDEQLERLAQLYGNGEDE